MSSPLIICDRKHIFVLTKFNCRAPCRLTHVVDIVCAFRANTLIIKFLSGRMNLAEWLLCNSGRSEGLLISRAFSFLLKNMIDDIIIPKAAIKAENVISEQVSRTLSGQRVSMELALGRRQYRPSPSSFDSGGN
jgi:hypothetical protein